MNVILLGLDENNRFAVRRFFVVLYDDVRDSKTIIIMRCVSRNFKPVRTLYRYLDGITMIFIYIRYVKKLLLLDLFMKIFEKKEMEEGTRKKRLRVFVYNFKYRNIWFSWSIKSINALTGRR